MEKQYSVVLLKSLQLVQVYFYYTFFFCKWSRLNNGA